ncbi:MAG: ArsR/SmtB family transcription factor [Erythrobacter sp.]
MTYVLKLEALAAPTRRAVFERLARSPASVTEIASGLPVSRPAVSQHLRVLREAGLAREERDGVRRIYSIDAAGLAELRDYFDGFWDSALQNFKQSAERDDQ